MEAELVASARDADLESRELGLALLAKAKYHDMARLSALQLRDPDPAARVLGLQYLRQFGDARFLPLMIPLLDDSELSVVAGAGSVLQKWTGQDFGIRLSLALPQFDRQDPVEPTRANAAVLAAGVSRAKDWWNLHQSGSPAPLLPTANDVASGRLAVEDFTFEDLDGKRVRLRQFQGKPVVLVFGDVAVPACLRYLNDLVKLQREDPDRWVILGISFDATAQECGRDTSTRTNTEPFPQPKLTSLSYAREYDRHC